MFVRDTRLRPWALAFVLFGCAEGAAPDPGCAPAQQLFDAIYPTTAAALGFKGVPAHAAPMELASGVAFAAVRRLPDQASRSACFEQIMRGQGHRFFPSHAETEAVLGDNRLEAYPRRSLPRSE